MAPAAVSVRDARPADRDAIRAVVEASFGGPAEADLVDALNDSGDAAISLVAAAGGEIAGHILFSRLEAPFPALALAPVSVVPDRQGKGIGATLIRAGLDRARAGGWRGVFVLGDPAYYGKFGFDVALAAGFASPYAGPYFMALGLNGPLPQSTGRIVYPAPFSQLA